MTENQTTNRIRELMGNMTQEAFANSIKSSQSVISKILSGEPPSLNVLTEIAKGYNVSIDWLLGLSDHKSLAGIKGIDYNSAITYVDVITVLSILLKKKSISFERVTSNDDIYPFPSNEYEKMGDFIQINDHIIGELVYSVNSMQKRFPNTINSWLDSICQDYNIELLEWTEYVNNYFAINTPHFSYLDMLKYLSNSNTPSENK